MQHLDVEFLDSNSAAHVFIEFSDLWGELIFAGQSVSSGSRVEANVLKANPELQRARMHTSSPTVYEDSPLPSDFMTDDATTSAGETPDRGTSTYFYGVPSSEPPNRRLTNVVFAPRSGLYRTTGDP